MSLFDELKKNVTDFTENVAKKSSEAIEVQKLKMQKSSLESDLRDCYVALGRLYEKRLADGCNPNSGEEQLLRKIASVRKSMTAIDEEQRKLKGVILCGSCGQSVSKDYDFCPKCGARLGDDGAATGSEAAENAQSENAQSDTAQSENAQGDTAQNENTQSDTTQSEESDNEE